ncbi:MAG: RecX family transcriptional regulator [Candidatus Cloacimonetes bacterium]|nr:RecX family transcriptional regulator [Candidatus Cloacimonadota bacterium]
MTKIHLTIPKHKKYLREIRTDEYSLGVLPLKSLPFSFRQVDPATYHETDEDPFLEVDETTLQEIKLTCYTFARDKLLDYLASSEKTRYDCTDFLKRYQIPEAQIQDLLTWAEEKKYLSDERYTEMFIEENILSCKSPEEIRFKLKQKRIDASLINEKLCERYTHESKMEILEQLIDKLVRSNIQTGKTKCYEKCATALYRKGFRYEEFKALLNQKIHNSLDE